MKITRHLLFAALSPLIFYSCSTDDDSISVKDLKTYSIGKGKAMSEFAAILSKATYENQSVREFLKQEASKKFDDNYDVLYANVKNKQIDGTSFQDILKSYSSNSKITQIENEVPLLNIYFPEIAVFNVGPATYNTVNRELPIAVSADAITPLYYNGLNTDYLEESEIPSFPILVVNENRHITEDQLTGGEQRGTINSVKSYDGTTAAPIVNNNDNSSVVGSKAVEAFNISKTNETSEIPQRDYIYYGVTPEDTTRTYNAEVNEYISFIEIEPKAYYKLSDYTNSRNNMPHISRGVDNNTTSWSASAKSATFLWTAGIYDFKVALTTLISETPTIQHIFLRPSDIWDFNIDSTSVRTKAFSHNKRTYKIDPDKFTAKRVDLTSRKIALTPWTPEERNLERKISFTEEDDNIETVDTCVVENDVTHDKETIVIKRQNTSDELGTIPLYFYDRIIEGKESDKKYILHWYNTGIVSFGITAY